MVDFDNVFDLPFFLNRSEGSVIREYIGAHNDEMQDFGDKLNEVMESHQIDNATGEELDQIGASFGLLGRRRGRDDQEYRIYLKSLVQSFRGRGTVPGIISAVAAGLNTDSTDVKIEEDFQNLEYTIELYDWSPHRGSTVEELAELSDASVSRLKRTDYKVDPEEMGVSDAVNTVVSTLVESEEISVDDLVNVDPNKIVVSDSFGVSDKAAANRRGVTDETEIDDATFINQNLFTLPEDVEIDDTPFIDQNLTTVGDDTAVDDTAAVNSDKVTEAEDVGVSDDAAANRRGVTDNTGAQDDVQTDTTNVAWDTGSWDEMNWAKNR